MRILDYATNRTLNDVAVTLTQEEAAELMAYLKRLVDKPQIHKVYLSEVTGFRLEQELTVAIDTAVIRAA
ncbi:MAG: hypothetical protein HY248_03040 [Fimbriimonas ginsengisoli]|uniref:Uncharacterized protein n=1 Tax=Fimbriimonas ginsengisoli TaxID=1005039 RepID=A0A931PSK2_FIMGI|nr:hypothetical protein [Fimbriimonas ginsengisoli]MBI3721504.1 hypothetical protein [Fimbriimonas ginsengisoli]